MAHQFKNLVELLQHRAVYQGSKTAYVFLSDGEKAADTITYAQLEKRVRSAAARLQSSVGFGERVLLLYPPSLEYIVSFLGCLYAGVIPVPAYPPDSRNLARLQTIASDAETVVALSTKATILRMDVLAQMADMDYVLQHTGNERAGTCPRNLYRLNWLATDDAEKDASDQWVAPPGNEDAIAFLQYTSGSTSNPKGVVLTHRNLLHNCHLMERYLRCTPDSVGVSWLPPYHDMGLIGGILLPIYSGFTVTLMAPSSFLKKPFRWLQAISRSKNQGKVISGAPDFAYNLCVDKVTPAQVAELDLSHWHTAFSGAEPVRAATLYRFAAKFETAGFQERAFFPVYGLAEGTLLASAGVAGALPVIKQFDTRQLEKNQAIEHLRGNRAELSVLVGCGKALDGQRVEIVDPETRRKCGSNEIGEIWLSGPSIAQGYWNNPGETNRAFLSRMVEPSEGPFFRTGDLGFVQEGELFVTGRLKDLIIIRGRNHYPQDIELTVAAAHSTLRPGGGVALSVPVGAEERLVIVQEVERQHRGDFDRGQITDAIVQAVSFHHALQVHAVVLVKPSSVPKTSSGKLQRHLCRKQYLEGALKVLETGPTPVAAGASLV